MRCQTGDFGAAGIGAVVCLIAFNTYQTHWGNPHLLKLSIPQTDGGLFICRAAFFQRFGNTKYRQQNCFVTHFLYVVLQLNRFYHLPCLPHKLFFILESASFSFHCYKQLLFLASHMQEWPICHLFFYAAVQLWQISSAPGWKTHVLAEVRWSKSASHSLFTFLQKFRF